MKMLQYAILMLITTIFSANYAAVVEPKVALAPEAKMPVVAKDAPVAQDVSAKLPKQLKPQPKNPIQVPVQISKTTVSIAPKIAQVASSKVKPTSTIMSLPKVAQAKNSSPDLTKVMPKVAVHTEPVVQEIKPKEEETAKHVVVKAASEAKVDHDVQQDEAVACSQIASVVYAQHIAHAPVSESEKFVLQRVLNSLYVGYLVRQSGTELFVKSGTSKQVVDQYWQLLKDDVAEYPTNPFCIYTALKQSPDDIASMRICIDTVSLQEMPVDPEFCAKNLLNMYEAASFYNGLLKGLLTHLQPSAFTLSQADPDGTLKNYATVHLKKAVERLAATSSIVTDGLSCMTKFTGDIRDMGVIVNIQNNTSKQYGIYQVSVKGSQRVQIGLLEPGLNNVNLHTAALQSEKATVATPSDTLFEITPMTANASSAQTIKLQMMSGVELLALLRSVSKHKKDIFIMNGNEVAKQYAVDEKGIFLVVSQIPVASSKGHDISHHQRIQAFWLSRHSLNPYLLTMQINEDEVEEPTAKDAKMSKKEIVQQPSLVSVQTLTHEKGAMPLVLLPDALVHHKVLKMYELLQHTAYIAALTDFEFFGDKCFANEGMYLDKLIFLFRKNAARIIVSLYDVFLGGKEIFEVPNIEESAIYECKLEDCRDIPQLYIYQDAQGNMVANVQDQYNFNIVLGLNDDMGVKIINDWYEYGIPFILDQFVSIPVNLLKESVFFSMQRMKDKCYQIIITDKHNVILGKYQIYLDEIKAIKLVFLGENNRWIGGIVPVDIVRLKDKIQFKAVCFSDNNVNRLAISAISPIDKIELIHQINFIKYPINELYFDIYNKYQVSDIVRCMVVESGKMPQCLINLTESDWKNGVYVIPSVANNAHLSHIDRGNLTLTFYDASAQQLLGSINIDGTNQNTKNIGIEETVHAYNVGGDSVVTQFNLSLSTSVLLKYS